MGGFSEKMLVQFNVAGSSHLVELPQVLLLCLVDYSQDSGDGLSDNTAATYKQSQILLHRVYCTGELASM